MLIAGAGGHAVETLMVLEQTLYKEPVAFYDDITVPVASRLLKSFPVLTEKYAAANWFALNNKFCLGVGNPAGRRWLTEKLENVGGVLTTLISPYAQMGNHEIEWGEGLTIMAGAVLTGRIRIGRGVLVHIHSSIHHDSTIGDYCELSPGCRILGRVSIGHYVSIGTGAIIMPGVSIGDNAVVGAGAVVLSSVQSGNVVAGIPAKVIRE